MASPRVELPRSFPAKRLLLGGTSAWYVPGHFEPIKKVSMSTHMEVVNFLDKGSGNVVSVKKVKDALRNMGDAQRLLREVKVLRFARHENLLSVVDAYAPSSLGDVYIVTLAMKSSLQRVLNSRQDVMLEHRQYFTHQMMRGLFYLHSAGLIHRDLRPSNILVNADCSLKICNFGLSRCREEEDGVVASEYRAPELLLGSRYTSAVDIWAAACIIGELARGAAVFGGRDNLDQIRRILQVLGPLPGEQFEWIPDSGRELLRGTARGGRPLSWAERLPGSPDAEVEILGSMLSFGPDGRPQARDVLRHPYLESFYSAADEEEAHCKFDWSFDRYALSDQEIRRHFEMECRVFQHCRASPGTQILTPKHQDLGLGVITTRNHLDREDSECGSEVSYGAISSPNEGLSPLSPATQSGRRQISEFVSESTASEVEERTGKLSPKLGMSITASRHRLGSG